MKKHFAGKGPMYFNGVQAIIHSLSSILCVIAKLPTKLLRYSLCYYEFYDSTYMAKIEELEYEWSEMQHSLLGNPTPTMTTVANHYEFYLLAYMIGIEQFEFEWSEMQHSLLGNLQLTFRSPQSVGGSTMVIIRTLQRCTHLTSRYYRSMTLTTY